MENKQSKSKDSNWVGSLIGSLIVGIVVLVGQAFLQPWVAEGIKRKESILEQRYKSCESAVNIMQRNLAATPMSGSAVPEWYKPPEKNPPTQVEWNTAYTMLAIYGTNDEIAEKFYAVSGVPEMKPSDIFKFVSAVRKELEVDKEGYTGDKMHYIFKRQVDSFAEPNQFQ